MNRIHRIALLLVALLALLAAGCGAEEAAVTPPDDSGGMTPSVTAPPTTTAPPETTAPPLTTEAPETTGTTTSTADAIEYDHAADDVVVQIQVGGGLVPQFVALTTVPVLTVYGDGLVLDQGAGETFADQRALPVLRQRHLDEAGLQTLLRAARDAGLLTEGADYGVPNIADAPSTTVTLHVGDTPFTQSAGALGLGEDGTGLTPTQIDARRKLSGFVSQALDLETLVGAGHIDAATPYAPEQIAVYGLEPQTDKANDRRPWPIKETAPPADPSKCVIFDGADATTLAAALADATWETRWTLSGREFAVAARPLGPGTTDASDGC